MIPNVSEAAPASRETRDRLLLGLAVLSVLAAAVTVAFAVFRRDSSRAVADSPETLQSLVAAVSDRNGVPVATLRPAAAELAEEVGFGRAPAWTPAPLPKADIAGSAANGAGAVGALKKCCDSLRNGRRGTFGRASDACDRMLATVSSRRGAMSDAIAAAALDAIREGAQKVRQPNASIVPASCR
jgi:hypothetical protein